jgi:hypothetical protein
VQVVPLDFFKTQILLMNAREIALIKKRMAPHEAVIRANMTKKKTDRDHDAIAFAKARLAVFNRWLSEDINKPQFVPPPVAKREAKITTFKEGDNFSMEIRDIAHLEEVFNNIVFKDVQIKAPLDVIEAYKLKVRDYMRSEEWRFQKHKGANCQFMGIDDKGLRWNCFLKVKSSRVEKAYDEVKLMLKIRNLDAWKKHNLYLTVKR